MRKPRLLPTLAAATLVTVGLVSTSGSASAAPFADIVAVHGGADGLTVQHGTVHAGLVRFLIDTTNDQGTDVVMITPAPGKTLDDVKTALHDEVTHDGPTAAKGTQELVANARIFGLAGVVKGTPVIVTEQVPAGTYYLFDLGPVFAGQQPDFTTLQVSGPGDDHPGSIFPVPRPGVSFPLSPPVLHRRPFPPPFSSPHHATVQLTSEDSFESPDVLPKTGTITVRNVSDTIHFMLVTPVKKGTTDEEIQNFFNTSTGPDDQPAFATDGPSIEMGVQSPGRQADISYRLPAGTYVLECFVADDKDGVPHAVMGMHKVVTLK